MVYIRIISYLFIILTLLPINNVFAAKLASTPYSSKVAYVPMDDRPVNLDRVVIAGKAMGVEVITPEVDLISTHLDSQGKNQTGKQFGDSQKIIEWLFEIKDQVDGFIISADMITSGGLFSSRSSNQKESLKQSQLNLDKILSLKSTKKPVYVFDSILRIAPSIGLDGYTIKDYYNIRNWASVPRKKSNTVQGIINNYGLSVYGSRINPLSFGVSLEKEKAYFNARERKLKLNDYLFTINSKKVHFDFLAFGVDDSAKTSIQDNEIIYFQDKIAKLKTDEIALTSDADGLGMALLGRFVNKNVYKTTPKITLSYFGIGKDELPGKYDYHVLSQNLSDHIKISGGVIVTSNADLEVLVRTPKGRDLEISRMITKMKQNIRAQIPTAVVDVSSSSAIQAQLADRILLNKVASQLVAYSSWNTPGNSIGLVIGYAPARVVHLKKEKIEKTNLTAEPHASYVYYSFIKDAVYQNKMLNQFVTLVNKQANSVNASDNMASYINSGLIDFVNLRKKANELLTPELIKVQKSFINQSVITKISSEKWTTKQIGTIFDNSNWIWMNEPNDNYIDFPWKRTFEAELKVKIYLK